MRKASFKVAVVTLTVSLLYTYPGYVSVYIIELFVFDLHLLPGEADWLLVMWDIKLLRFEVTCWEKVFKELEYCIMYIGYWSWREFVMQLLMSSFSLKRGTSCLILLEDSK